MDRREFIKGLFAVAAGAVLPPGVNTLADALATAVDPDKEPLCWLEVDSEDFKGRIPLSTPRIVRRDATKIVYDFATVDWTHRVAMITIAGPRCAPSTQICLIAGDSLNVTYTQNLIPA